MQEGVQPLSVLSDELLASLHDIPPTFHIPSLHLLLPHPHKSHTAHPHKTLRQLLEKTTFSGSEVKSVCTCVCARVCVIYKVTCPAGLPLSGAVGGV